MPTRAPTRRAHEEQVSADGDWVEASRTHDMEKYRVQISLITPNGGRTTRTDVIDAAGPKAARVEAERVAARYPRGRVVSIGKR
jgi:hypothetical protein